MSIQRERESKILTISQKSYLENILKWFGMQDCKPVSTPLEPGKKYDKLQDDRDPVDVQRYQVAIGSGSIWSTWSCYWLDQFLTLALDAWILSKFSTLYWICLLLVFLILVGVELPLCL